MELNLSISLLRQICDCQISPNVDDSLVVRRLCSLSAAGPDDLAIILDRGDASVFDAISLEAIKNSKAGILMAQTAIIPDKRYLLVSNTLAAFERLIAYVQLHQPVVDAPSIPSDVVVDPSAVISPGAVIGQGAIIGAQVFVGRHCIVGEHTVLHPGVKVLDRCIIGSHCVVHAGTVIGSDGFGYQVSKSGLKKIPQVGIVRVGNYVEIGANGTIDRAAFDETVIGDGVKIDNLVHLAHNVKVGAHTVILAQTGIAGSTVVGAGCQIGGQVAVKDHLVIGNGVKIVSKSGVMNNLKDGEVVAGMPAMPFGQWKRLVVVLNKLPDFMKKVEGFPLGARSATKSWWKRLFS